MARTRCICGVRLADIDSEAARTRNYVDPQNPCSVFFHAYPGLLAVVDKLRAGDYSEWDVSSGKPVLVGEDDIRIGVLSDGKYYRGHAQVDLTALELWLSVTRFRKDKRRLTKEQRHKLQEYDDAIG